MRPINKNYLSVDANDIVDKHDLPRAMYKWSNKENQKRMTNPIVGASHGFYPPLSQPLIQSPIQSMSATINDQVYD